MDWIRVTPDLNFKTNEFIKEGISVLVGNYLDELVDVN